MIYHNCDSSGTRCDTATLEVFIGNIPLPEDDFMVLSENTAGSIEVQGNDSTTVGTILDPSTISIVTDGADGHVQLLEAAPMK